MTRRSKTPPNKRLDLIRAHSRVLSAAKPLAYCFIAGERWRSVRLPPAAHQHTRRASAAGDEPSSSHDPSLHGRAVLGKKRVPAQFGRRRSWSTRFLVEGAPGRRGSWSTGPRHGIEIAFGDTSTKRHRHCSASGTFADLAVGQNRSMSRKRMRKSKRSARAFSEAIPLGGSDWVTRTVDTLAAQPMLRPRGRPPKAIKE